MSPSRTRARARLQLAAAAALLAGVAVFATAAPASAHDSLLSSTPTPGERLAVAPSEISLRFSDDVLALGAAIIVIDEGGRDWALPDPVVVENTVSAALSPGMPAAGYELRWRVVSSDGHPISGVIPFTVGDGEPFIGTKGGTGEEVPLGPESEPGSESALNSGSEPDRGADPGAAPGADPDAGSPGAQRSTGAVDVLRSFAIGIGGAALALGVALLIQFITRRVRRKGTESSDPTEHLTHS